jgi:hypothetical protein
VTPRRECARERLSDLLGADRTLAIRLTRKMGCVLDCQYLKSYNKAAPH